GARPDRGVPGGGARGELREADARRRVHPAHRAPLGGGVMPGTRHLADSTLAVATLWRREVIRFVRQRSRLLGALVQPLVFWALLGGGLSPSFRPPGAPVGASYLAYLYPGILALVLLFTAIFATISTVEDRHSGFLQGVLVAPVSRTAIVVGQALGGTTLAVGQGLAFLALAPLAGIRLAPFVFSLGVAMVFGAGACAAAVATARRSVAA